MGALLSTARTWALELATRIRQMQPVVANVVSFFCDAKAAFITEQTLFDCFGVTVG